MRTVRTRLPCELVSNLVFSSGAEMLFGLSRDGDLVCLTVPSNPDAVVEPPSVVRRADQGACIAAGWLEGRLATITISGDELRLSHGWSGEVGVHQSVPSTLRLDRSEMRLSARARLEPYVRWHHEINPVECWWIAEALVRDDDDRLFVVATEWGDAKQCSAFPVADGVLGLAGLEDPGMAAFVGRPLAVDPPKPRSRWFGKRPPPASPPTRKLFVVQGSRFEPSTFPDIDGEPSIALVQFYGGREYILAAAARHANERCWTLVSIWSGIKGRVESDVLELRPGDAVVGIALAPPREPALILLDASRNRLFESWQTGSSLFESDVAIDEVAVAPSGPHLVAMLTRRAEVIFCWPWA